MKNRIYYGEYNLAHWIKLMLSSNIVLPEYQRLFVWKEADVINFINQVKDDQFVPTLTIGHYVENDGKQLNWILDGQQRLSSLLLAYLGLYPDQNVFKAKIEEQYANDNDDVLLELDANNNPIEDDAQVQDELDDILNWQYSQLVAHGTSKDEILSHIVPGNYKHVDYGVDEEFFESHYIGFSYLVPQEDPNKQLRYYSTLFRNINKQGVALEDLESRASLYYLEPYLKDFFIPKFMEVYKLKLTGELKKLDFVRYLSLLSQYAVDERKSHVAVGTNQRAMERYYEDYINAVVLDAPNTKFKQFSSIFPDKQFENRLNLLKDNINKMHLESHYNSIIDLDVTFFGLIYISLFKGEHLTDDQVKIDRLKARLRRRVEVFKQNVNHRKSPAGIGYLRERLDTSVKLYNTYKL